MKRILLIFTIMLLLTACGGGETAEEATEDPVVETVVVVATPTEAPAEETTTDPAAEESAEETAVTDDTPVLEAPTAAPGEPTVTALVDLNIRTGPGTNYAIIGALRANNSARIIGRSSGGGWWKIECPAGTGPECWLSAGAQYSQAADAAGVAVAAAPPPPATHTPTATQTTDATPTSTATTAVADGTATATATATATTAVDAPTATATATLAANEPTATATSTATPTATPTTAVQIAPFDNDSLQNPALSINFSPTGTRNFTYSNDISYPDGDQEDWVEFQFPNNSNSAQQVWLTLECNYVTEDNVQVIANISEDGVPSTKRAFCNDGETQLTVDNTKVQQVRIYFQITGEAYVTYTLTVVGYR